MLNLCPKTVIPNKLEWDPQFIRLPVFSGFTPVLTLIEYAISLKSLAEKDPDLGFERKFDLIDRYDQNSM